MADTLPYANIADSTLLKADKPVDIRLVNWLFPVFIALIALAFVALWKWCGTAAGRPLDIPKSLFIVVDAATLTGFRCTGSIVPALQDLSFRAQIIVVLLNIVGSLFALIGGGIAVTKILRLGFKPWQIIVTALLLQAVAGGIGYGFLGDADEDRKVQALSGISRGIAAFGNYGASIGRTPLGLHHWQTYAFVLPLAVFGGLGITVLLELLLSLKPAGRSRVGNAMDLLSPPARKTLSLHARTVITWSFGLYLFGTLLFVLSQWIDAHFTRDPDKMRELWATSSAMAIVTRTAGISYKFGYAFPRSMMWMMMLLMFIGASPGGTGGGVKTTTFAAIINGARRLLRGNAPGRQLGFALAWLGIYSAMVLAGLLMLLVSEPQISSDQLLVMAVSAIGNVGLAYDQLSPSISGIFVLSTLMLAGRLAPLLMLVWMAEAPEESELAVG